MVQNRIWSLHNMSKT